MEFCHIDFSFLDFHALGLQQCDFFRNFLALGGSKKSANLPIAFDNAVAGDLGGKRISFQCLTDRLRRTNADDSCDFLVGGNFSARNGPDHGINLSRKNCELVICNHAATMNDIHPIAIMKHTLLLFATLPLTCFADDLDYGVAKFQWFSHTDVEANSGAPDMSLEQWRIQTSLSKPIELAQALYFLPGLRYEYTDFEGAGLGLGSIDTDLHMIEVPLLFVYKPTDSPWSYNARFSPGIASDFDSVDSDDYFFDVRLGAEYKFSDRLSVNFGVAYTRVTGEPEVLPYLGFEYNMNDQWQFAVRGMTVEARCKVNESWIVRFIGEAGGGYWNIDTPNSDYLSVQSYRVGVSIEHELTKDLWLTAGAGFTLANEVEWMDDSDRTLRKEDYDSGGYFTVGLRLHDW